MDQLSLNFDAMTPRQLGQLGEDRAIGAAGQEWRGAASWALYKVCKRWQRFIVDQVWDELGKREDEPDRRAMAGVLSEGEKNGWCVRTDDMQRSNQKQCHGNKRQVWRSLLV